MKKRKREWGRGDRSSRVKQGMIEGDRGNGDSKKRLKIGGKETKTYIAFNFGAPETVPAGNIERKASNSVHSGLNFPVTQDTMCITCENISTCIKESTLVVSG